MLLPEHLRWENLDRLIITNARESLSGAELEKYPKGGNTLWAKAGVKGFASNNACFNVFPHFDNSNLQV